MTRSRHEAAARHGPLPSPVAEHAGQAAGGGGRGVKHCGGLDETHLWKVTGSTVRHEHLLHAQERPPLGTVACWLLQY